MAARSGGRIPITPEGGRNMKRILTAILLAALLLAAATAAAAATELSAAPSGQAETDADQSMENAVYEPAPGGSVVEPSVGDGTVIRPASDPEDDAEPYGSGALPGSANGNDVWLTDRMYYDAGQGVFVYLVGSGDTVVRSSVADGMIVTEPVMVDGATLLIYQDGELWEGDAMAISEPGEYVVMAQTGNQTPRLFTFTLAGPAVSGVYAYNMPSGMAVLNATLNGEQTEFDRSSVPMQAEGTYRVEYECLSTGKIYSLELVVDRTPPELEFHGDIDGSNRVHSALGFSGVQPGDTVLATLDGASIDVTVASDGTGEFTQSGSYIITVFDAAGNRSVYGYTVMLYFNASSLAFFAVLIATVLAVLIYVFMKRKRLEIG